MRVHPVLVTYLVAVSVLAVTSYSLIVTAEDASIGGGFAQLLLIGAALPWSLPAVVAFDSLSDPLPLSILWFMAAANGLLVAWCWPAGPERLAERRNPSAADERALTRTPGGR